MKYADLLASARLPASLPARGHVVFGAGVWSDRRDRPDSVPDGPGDQLDQRSFEARPGAVGGGDRPRRDRPARSERGPPDGCGPGFPWGRARPAQRALQPSPATRAVVLRPPADRAAD